MTVRPWGDFPSGTAGLWVFAVIRSVLGRAEAGQAICPDEPLVMDAVVAGCHRLSWSRPSLALSLGNASKPPGSPLSDFWEQ